MITGTVTPDREAVLRLAIRDASGQEHEQTVIIDTGYNGWLTLPPNLVASLGLRSGSGSGRRCWPTAAKSFSTSTRRSSFGTVSL